MLNFTLQVLGVKPEDITLLMTDDLFHKIAKQVLLEDEEKKAGCQYYLQEKHDDIQLLYKVWSE